MLPERYLDDLNKKHGGKRRRSSVCGGLLVVPQVEAGKEEHISLSSSIERERETERERLRDVLQYFIINFLSHA